MKKKIILGIVVVTVLVLATVVIVVGTHLGDIVKTGVETVGPRITQTAVTVDKVNISILSGSAGVNGLVLGNPKGYQATNAITVGVAAVSLSPASLLKDKIVVHSVEVRSPEITFEGNPFGANNLNQLMDNVNGGAAAVDKSTNAPATATPAEKKAAKKLQVDDLLITGAKVHANITSLNRQVTLTLPDIHLTNLGSGPDGITAADLTKTVLGEITSSTLKAITTMVANLGKDVTGAGKSAIQGVGGAASNSVDQLKKGIGNLFGK